ncbi:TPA: 50S ribosomal protein L11 methyltransferase [Candidatus Scatousia excrementigallinarum]|uniref:Ribosomal protein L11 methyltransferase n=1 Tax=Candidatus Scatousia excrementigallinarum TaxID=2840935 RepID=A0A9D1F1I4_9BACT|nr:50S ribosomal protein L11 methyltransferase [Candidatus Scatousia excrementigallinarum]
MNSYYELQIKINPEIEDIVSDICFEYLPCEGVVLAEEAYKDLEMISTTEGTLRVFLTEKADVEHILKEQRELLKSRGLTDDELGSWEFSYAEKENEDWSKKWKEKWDVTHVSDRITVVPDWIDYTPQCSDEVIIKLEPGCAFGTGTHSTTQLCMKAIEKYMPKNADVADIGMGSGILAICAKKFGAKSVYGCDNDETVIDVAIENAIKNNADCEFELNTADKINKQFDFVLANILHNVLAEIMGDLKAIMKDGAYMVLSGILDEKKPVVIDAIKKHNLELVEEMHQNQWVALVVRR